MADFNTKKEWLKEAIQRVEKDIEILEADGGLSWITEYFGTKEAKMSDEQLKDCEELRQLRLSIVKWSKLSLEKELSAL